MITPLRTSLEGVGVITPLRTSLEGVGMITPLRAGLGRGRGDNSTKGWFGKR